MGQTAHPSTNAGHTVPALGLAARAGFVLLPLAALAVVVSLLARFDLPLAGSIEWVPALGIALAWRIDGLAALMLLMITGVGSAVFIYAGGYLAGHPGQRRLYVLLTLFMLAMIGCVTADNLFTLFLFWEATSVLSFLLVGFEHERAATITSWPTSGGRRCGVRRTRSLLGRSGHSAVSVPPGLASRPRRRNRPTPCASSTPCKPSRMKANASPPGRAEEGAAIARRTRFITWPKCTGGSCQAPRSAPRAHRDNRPTAGVQWSRFGVRRPEPA